jgi:hypothetical protein
MPTVTSGSETRQRTKGTHLRFLPEEHAVLEQIAKRRGFKSVQALILENLQPLITAAE